MVNNIDREFEIATISIVKSAVDGTKAKLPENFQWKNFLLFAKSQSLLPLVHYGAMNSKIEIPAEYVDRLSEQVLTYFIVDQHQQYEIKKILTAFEENGVDYMMIKGVLLRHLYPKTDMRPMGDMDVMIRENQRDVIVQILELLGYTYSYETAHELVYKKNDVVIELHKCLIPPRTKDFYEYYKDSWSFAKKIDGLNNRYEMSDEDHLVFLVTHFAKHYRAGGIGVLHMVDFYLYLKKKKLNNSYVRRELDKLNLLEFYDNVVVTIENWFNDGPGGERCDFITHRIFTNGLWGTEETHAKAAAVRTSRLSYSLRQLFPRIEGMKLRYPVLKKHSYLLPVMWGARGFDLLFFKRKRVRKKLDMLKDADGNSLDSYQKELNYVGLDFNYKE